MAERRNGISVRQVIAEIWTLGHLEAADLLFAPTYVNHGGLVPDLVRGPEAIKISVALYRSAFPTLQITIESVVAEGELVELCWAAHCTPPDLADIPVGADRRETSTSIWW